MTDHAASTAVVVVAGTVADAAEIGVAVAATADHADRAVTMPVAMAAAADHEGAWVASMANVDRARPQDR
ncbi:MAG: hypothetical protein HOL45_01630 [Chloroflexi bacterium]|nr:hypothetical protein [Chloroflexota bacterium]